MSSEPASRDPAGSASGLPFEVPLFDCAGAACLARLDANDEVLLPALLRPIPGSPMALLGVLNLRGDMLPIINALAQSGRLARETLQERLRAISERLGRAGTECETFTDAHDRTESRLRHLSDDLFDEVTQARLVPLSELLDDYPRMLGDLAHELGKRIDGADNPIDRAVLDLVAEMLST